MSPELPPEWRQPSGGERVDRAAHDAIKLAHEAIERFPELMLRHKYIAGGAAVSGSLIALASVAIVRRMRRGESAEEAVAGVTEEEIQALRVVEPKPSSPHEDAGGADPDAVPEADRAVS